MIAKSEAMDIPQKSNLTRKREKEDQQNDSQESKNSNSERGGLLQPLINESQLDSIEQDIQSQQPYSHPSLQSYRQEQNVFRNEQMGTKRQIMNQRDSQMVEKRGIKRRSNKLGLVCLNKRQMYLKNMKIYNALYNFTPPNQRLKTSSEKQSFIQYINEKIPVFEPSNKYLLFWEFTIFLLTCIIFFFIPIELFFQINLVPIVGYGMAIRILIFIFYIFDIILYLNIGFFDKGKLIIDRKLIFKNYLGNFLNGKSLTDIIGLIGIIINLFQSDKSDLQVSDYFCLIFYIRLINLNEFDTVIIQQLQLNRKSKCAYQLLRLGIVVLFISNFFACIFYRVGYIEQNAIGSSWFITIEQKLGEEYVPTLLIYYLYSLYWSMTTMISVGYGDVTPVAPYEVLVTIVCMMCSCILFAYSINSIWFIISEVSMGSKRYELNMNAINRFMRDKSINPKLKKRIQAYLDFHWKGTKSRETDKENEIIQSLPQNLKLELIYEANSFFFQQFEWSKHFSYGFLQLLSQYIKEKKYLEDDLLYEVNL